MLHEPLKAVPLKTNALQGAKLAQEHVLVDILSQELASSLHINAVQWFAKGSLDKDFLQCNHAFELLRWESSAEIRQHAIHCLQELSEKLFLCGLDFLDII